jgi:hypothetical protein
MLRSTILLLALALQANISSERLAKLLLLLRLLMRKMKRSIFLETTTKKRTPRLKKSRLSVSLPTTRKRPISPRVSRRSVEVFEGPAS